MSYAEKLKDPRWQRKRLEILQRDDFTCKKCGDKQTTLHVHHRRYFKGNDPWDYPNELLVTLCEDCHEVEGTTASQNHTELIEYLQSAGVFDSEMSYQGFLIAEGIKKFGLKNIEFINIRIAISESFREAILKLIEQEKATLKSNEEDIGF
jgi:hypothetical protein